MICPKCGSDHVDRDEVDIGVGTQCGPWGCFDCGWVEGDLERACSGCLPEYGDCLNAGCYLELLREPTEDGQ